MIRVGAVSTDALIVWWRRNKNKSTTPQRLVIKYPSYYTARFDIRKNKYFDTKQIDEVESQ